MLFYAQIQSHINYGLGVWGPMVSGSSLCKLQKAHENCLELVYAHNDIWPLAEDGGFLNLKKTNQA